LESDKFYLCVKIYDCKTKSVRNKLLLRLLGVLGTGMNGSICSRACFCSFDFYFF